MKNNLVAKELSMKVCILWFLKTYLILDLKTLLTSAVHFDSNFGIIFLDWSLGFSLNISSSVIGRLNPRMTRLWKKNNDTLTMV